MQSSIAFGPAAPAPPASLLARFDRTVPRNLGLPPLESLSPGFAAADLRDALARRRRPDGPARSLPLHLVVRLPCGSCPDGGSMLDEAGREAQALAEALGSPQAVARATFQTCDGMRMGDRHLGVMLDSLAARFRLSDAEICVEALRVDLPTLADWRAAGATRLCLTGPAPDPASIARTSGSMATGVSVDCGRRGTDAQGLATMLRSLSAAGVARVDLGTHCCIAARGAPACRDALLPVSPHARRAASRAAAVDVLLREGFQHVACGLFVRRGDPLLAAAHHGRLHLEVDGLAAAPAAGALAIGPGAFGRLASVFYRNAGGPADYAETVARQGLSVAAGALLSRRALAARAAVASLVCNGRVDFEAIALSHLIDARQEFVRALRELAPMVRAGLVDLDADGVELTPLGRHLVEVVAAVFEPRGA
jgi:oxygen-independent coproporphyrinogen-3 oxidase